MVRQSEKYFASMIKQSRVYCGAKPEEKKFRDHKFSILSNGIDRVNNLEGYILDNCVPCCVLCNTAKNNLTLEDFKSWAFRLIRCFTKE